MGIKRHPATGDNEATIVVCPFMSNELDEYCRDHRVNSIDLSGSSFLSWPGVHIHVRGNRNQFPTSGRAATQNAMKPSIGLSKNSRALVSKQLIPIFFAFTWQTTLKGA